jgi:uncharacterized secreted protein with C-terminal beta-propeller domain
LLKGSGLSLGISSKMLSETTAGAPMAADVSQGASDYSQTNVQVEGVDEADFVKNDSRFVYLLSGNYLLIFDALDSNTGRVVSKTEITGVNSDYGIPVKVSSMPYYYGNSQARDLFIKDNQLVVFMQEYRQDYYFPEFDIKPVETSRPFTTALIFDISDRSNPKKTSEISFTGNYYQSRLIGGKVYLITQENSGYASTIPEPLIKESSQTLHPSIYYFDNPESEQVFNTIASIDLASQKVQDSKVLLLGYANTVYVSEKNLYIAYKKQQYYSCWGFRPCYNSQDNDSERFFNVIVPKLPVDLRTKIAAINSGPGSEAEKWQAIALELSAFYEKAKNGDEIAKQALDDIAIALEEYDTKKALEQQATVIHKLALNDGQIEYKAKGEVFGDLLNQFSLDEKDNYLRVATTVSVWMQKRIQNNNVFILDSDLKEVSKLTGLSPDERIYSSRFLGNRLYLVTFRQVDPFFVIDLSNPLRPEVLGALKLPGFSQYLHALDDTHIIGVGKETDESGRLQGLKIALFDVSDPTNPKEASKIELGDQGSDSEILQDHKAFLLSKTKNKMVIPATIVQRIAKINDYDYRTKTWSGAIVFNVSSSGFEEVGRIQHSVSEQDYYNYWQQANVKRSLYLDNLLFTISGQFLKVNNWEQSGMPLLQSIALPGNQQTRGYPGAEENPQIS